LALQQHVKADEVGLSKTTEVGLVLRDLLIARGNLDNFRCLYLTKGGLLDDVKSKLQSVCVVLIGAIMETVKIGKMDSFVRDELKTLYHERYKVFYKRLGWNIPVKDVYDVDAYDHNGTYYINHYQSNELVGGCRLIPTTCKYMAKDLWREMAGEEPNGKIWELSRMFVSEKAESKTYVFGKIMKNAYEFARRNSIEKYLIVTNLAIERILNSSGVTVERISEPKITESGKIIAGYVHINEALEIALDAMLNKARA